MSQSLKDTIGQAQKDAMRAREKERLGTIRLIMAEIKRIEVDERIEVDDDRLLAVLDKMRKQRKDSVEQYQSAGREDLAAVELAEIEVIEGFLPQALSEDEIKSLIQAAIEETGAESMRDMGKVMGLVKPQVQGRGDMSVVSQLVKQLLG